MLIFREYKLKTDVLFAIFILIIASVKTAAEEGNDEVKPKGEDNGPVKIFQWLAHFGIERSLMERSSAVPVLKTTLAPALQKTRSTNTPSQNHKHNKHNNHNSHNNHINHHRVRRMLGQKNRCFTELKKFCRYFTHEGITDKLCLVVPAKRCTALDC